MYPARQYTIQVRSRASEDEQAVLKAAVIAAARALQGEGRTLVVFSDDFFVGKEELKW